MTNLTVLRTAQHTGWPGYCWPFPGNGFPLTTPSSPSVPNMANPSPCRPPSPAHLRGPPSPTQLQRLSRAYEEHFLQLTAAAAAASAGHSNGGGVKMEPLSPDPLMISNKETKNSSTTKESNHNSNGKSKPKQSRASPAQPPASSVPNDSSSPSASPKSQSSTRTKTPVSFSGTPPHPSFTPPIGLPPGCFNPAALGGLSGPSSVGNVPRAAHFLEPPALPRNCSDLMRSLAAKYNNNNNIELYTNQMNKSFPRLGMNSMMQAKTGYSPPVNSSPHAEESHGDSVSSSKASPSKLFSPFMPHSPLNEIHQSPVSSHSSAKALMDLVRNSSASKSSLDTAPHPLNSSMKRYPESSSPLDLSSGDSAKRIRYDLSMDSRTAFISKHDLLSESHPTAVDLEKNIPDVRLSPDCVSKDRMSQGLNLNQKSKDSGLPNARLSPANSHADSSAMRGSSTLEARLSPKLNCSGPQENLQNNEIRDSGASSLRTGGVLSWTVEDVCAFVKSIDLCAEYADMFAEERIDGWCLSLLTETHLTCNLGLKLGPALKLRSLLASMTSAADGDGATNCHGCRSGNATCGSKDAWNSRCSRSSEDGSVREAVANDHDMKKNSVSNYNNNNNIINNNNIQSKSSPGHQERRTSCSSENTQPSPSRFSCESPSTPHGELKISSPGIEDSQYSSVSRESKSSSPS